MTHREQHTTASVVSFMSENASETTRRLAPRSSAELFADCLPLSPKQRQVIDVVHSHPRGARAADVAAQLGTHINTARGHLEELAAQGAVRIERSDAVGRGRPSLIYHAAVADSRAVAREYIGLIGVLADALIGEGRKANKIPEACDMDRAADIGRTWARSMDEISTMASVAQNETAGNARSVLVSQLYHRLRAMGFDPTVEVETAEEGSTDSDTTDTRPAEATIMTLHACPFVAAGRTPSAFLCAIHGGFLQEIAESVGKQGARSKPARVTLESLTAEGACTVRIG